MTLKIRPVKLKFKVGDIIYATMVLRAGRQGVYLSKMAAETGLRGLFLDLKNLDNKSVLTCDFGSSGLHRSAGIDAAQTLDMEFMFLKSNEVRKFRHSLSCVPKVPGRYLVTAEYRPLDPDTQRVASLPKTKGLVLQEVVVAEPVEISIE